MLSATYILALVLANLTVFYFGPPVMPAIGFILIGLDLSLRDRLHDQWKDHLWTRMFSLIALAGVASWVLNPAGGHIAVASVAAFVLASIADTVTYHTLRERRWVIRANGSNIFGAAVDSVIFPWMAFGLLDWRIILGMFVAKVTGGAVWAMILAPTRRTI
jgi:uncharacterized PurR-regulated membrane protein YhhQ (DUF165 family)